MRSAVAAAALGVTLLIGARAPAPSRSRPRLRTVAISGFEFKPGSFTASLGDTIVWTNGDIVHHTATSDRPQFDSPDLSPKETFRFVAKEKGKFTYHCEIHSTMKGIVVVK